MLIAIFTVLAALSTIACDLGPQAGSFNARFEFAEGVHPPTETLSLRAALEHWPDGNIDEARRLSEAGPVDFDTHAAITFDQIAYGSDRVVIAELSASSDKDARVIYAGRSELFSIEEGKDILVPVSLDLTPTPGSDPTGEVSGITLRFTDATQNIVFPHTVDRTKEGNIQVEVKVKDATEVTLANDPAMIAGQKSWLLSELTPTIDGYYSFPEFWDLNAGLPEGAADIDGIRQVFAVARDALGYESELGQASITIDRQGPAVVSATLLRIPLFAPSVDSPNDSVYFFSNDPLTGIAVQARWMIFLDEERATGDPAPTLVATHETTHETLTFIFDEEASGEKVLEFSAKIATSLSDGIYNSALVTRDLLGNKTRRDLTTLLIIESNALTFALNDTAMDGSVDAVYERNPYGSDASDGLAEHRITGTIYEDDAVYILALASEIPASIGDIEIPDPGDASALIGYTNEIGNDGSFEINRLSRSELPFVFLSIVSRSGAISPPAVVQNNLWTATLNGKRAGSTTSNPLDIRVTHSFSQESFVQLSVEPTSLSATHGADHNGLVTTQKPEWRQYPMKTSALPLRRENHSMLFLPDSETILLYGGAGCNLIDDWSFADSIKTWNWNIKSNNWQEVSMLGDINPGPRERAAMAWDSLHGRALLFGGSDGNTDLWQWNTKDQSWSVIDISPNTEGEILPPSARQSASLAYDSTNDLLWLFGGMDTEGRKNDLYYFTPTGSHSGTWTQLSDPTDLLPWPPPRQHAGFLFDSFNQRLLLYGGNSEKAIGHGPEGTTLSDFWSF
ncbi:hypothetical protein KAI87_05980, partial [Myxococcota bacterium]|nr:hypothetical protein [Myxococcota bacterium]